MTDHMGSTCAHHYPHTKFCGSRLARSLYSQNVQRAWVAFGGRKLKVT